MWFRSNCKTCGHFHHHSLSRKNLGMGRCVWDKISVKRSAKHRTKYGFKLPMLCMCLGKDYVPDDNLDYIEWLAEKRGLVPLSETIK